VLGFTKIAGKKILQGRKAYAFRYPSGQQRVKLLPAIETEEGEIKYLSEKGQSPTLFYVCGLKKLASVKEPIYITEGEKKTIALQQQVAGAAVGLPGVGNYALVNSLQVKKRTVQLFLDMDYTKKPAVESAYISLYLLLFKRGAAQINISLWPPCHKGIDDLIAKGEFDLVRTEADPFLAFPSLSGINGQRFLCEQIVALMYSKKEYMALFHGIGLGERFNLPPEKWESLLAGMYKKKIEFESAKKENQNVPYSQITKVIPHNHEDNASFVISPEGVFFVKKYFFAEKQETVYKRICVDPVQIVAISRDVATSQCFATIALRGASWTLPTSELSGDLKTVSSLGIAVQRPNATAMSEFFLACQENIILSGEFKRHSTRQGWTDDTCTQFILGEQIISKNDDEILVEKLGKDPNPTISLAQKGAMEKWINVVAPWAVDPQLQIMLGASVISPFLKPLGIDSKVIHLYGESSSGKSVITAIAASIWGKPTGTNSIKKNWKGTRVSAEIIFSCLNNLPTFLEDSQMADNEYVFETIMFYGNGAGRPRATVSLNMEKQTSWQGFCISTGERAVFDSSNYGGVVSRSIEIVRQNFKGEGIYANKGKIPESRFYELKMGIEENHGFGQAVIEFWLKNEKKIREKYAQMIFALEQLETIKSDSKKQRLVGAFAAIATGCWLCNQLFATRFDWELVANEFVKSIESKPTTGIEKLYAELCAITASNPERVGIMMEETYGATTRWKFVDTDRKNVLAILHPGINALCFLPGPLEKYLGERKYGLSQVTDLLEKEGLLYADAGRKQYRLKIEGQRLATYAVKLPAAAPED